MYDLGGSQKTFSALCIHRCRSRVRLLALFTYSRIERLESGRGGWGGGVVLVDTDSQVWTEVGLVPAGTL